MKNKFGLIGLLLVIGLSLNFYSCEKDSNDDEPDPDPVGDATLTGTILNSQTGTGLANVTLYFTRNLSATTYDNAHYVVTTDSNGNFTLTNAISGNYICFVVSNGYFQRIITGIILGSGSNTLETVTLVDAPEAGSLRIVLTWGITPADLDSHLTGPEDDGERFHMYYSNQNPNEYVSLDVDDRQGEGPETTTITGFYNGIYRYSVHNYTDQSNEGGSGIKTSPAKVELYDSQGLVQTFNPPNFSSGTGNTWRVFEITINDGSYTVNAVNTYVYAASYTDMTIFKSTDVKSELNITDF